jgi:hypothetical protein
VAAQALLDMGYRGYLLMLAAEDGPGAPVARAVLEQADQQAAPDDADP